MKKTNIREIIRTVINDVILEDVHKSPEEKAIELVKVYLWKPANTKTHINCTGLADAKKYAIKDVEKIIATSTDVDYWNKVKKEISHL